MTEQLHYPNAPILEAIIDFRVKQAENVDIKNLFQIAERNRDAYPHQEELHSVLGQAIFQVGENIDSHSNITRQPIGLRLTDQAKKYSAQVRVDGFTFSAFHPYNCWDTFCAEAKRLWKQYQAASEIQNIWRVALRYVNRFNFPIDKRLELSDFLKTAPQIANIEGQEIANFFMQLQLWQADIDCMLILNEGIATPIDEKHISFIFDIDLFQEKVAQPWRIEEEQSVWEFLEILRTRKNEFFEASITEKTRELIK